MKAFDGVVAQLDLIWTAVNASGSERMPPAEDGYEPLDSCQLAALKAWMDLGAPESSSLLLDSLPPCQDDSPS
jgi:hypothetical protein